MAFDYQGFLIIILAFSLVAVLFPSLVTGISGISESEPLKWLFDVIPFAFIGTFILVLALWGTKQR